MLVIVPEKRPDVVVLNHKCERRAQEEKEKARRWKSERKPWEMTKQRIAASHEPTPRSTNGSCPESTPPWKGEREA